AEVEQLSAEALTLGRIADDSPQAIREKRARYSTLQEEAGRNRTACNLWTAAFFQRVGSEGAGSGGHPLAPFITTDTLRRHLESGTAHPQAVAQAQALAVEHRFFHWPLEFPEVFAQGGFDVVLGNPPWEQIQLQEQEFFAPRAPEIANAPNTAARRRRIHELPHTNPELYRQYQDALHAAESTSRFLRGSGQYPLTGRGRINTYSVFAERMRRLLRPGGRAGVIVPTGIATDDTNKHFFADLVEHGALVSLYDFENREGIFPHVHRSYKFSLLTIQRRSESTRQGAERAHFAFFCTRAEHLRDSRRVFPLLPADIARINPNTRTLPVFRTRQDAELTRAIYERVPVLVNERTGENPWGISFRQGLFHLTNDLRKRNIFDGSVVAVRSGNSLLSLYEAKLIWQFDHRFATYLLNSDERTTKDPHEFPAAKKLLSSAVIVGRYYVSPDVLTARISWEYQRDWFLVYRDVARSTDERTVISAIIPRRGVAYT
ncbi:hypothetical protein D6833_00800, partial [Candidatus Parcubacteria bacterium]